MVEVDSAASWMASANEIMGQVWSWTGMTIAGSIAIAIACWILGGRKKESRG